MKQLLIFFISISFLAGCNVSGLDGSSSSESTSATTVSSTTYTYGDVMLYWSEPTERADGSEMDSNDIGGYEIRYKLDSDDSYTVLVISGSGTTQLLLEDIANPTEQSIEVAVFDTNGIYSDYVEATTTN